MMLPRRHSNDKNPQRSKTGREARVPLEWPEWAEFFDAIVHQKRLSDTEKMQYLKINLIAHPKVAISGLGFSSQAYYQACDILCKFVRPKVIVESQLKKICTHLPVKNYDSSSIVRFANVVTNTVNVLTRLGFQHGPEMEGVLSSATKKVSPH